MIFRTNIRLKAKHEGGTPGEVDGEWIVYTAEKLRYVLNSLRYYQSTEPARGWHLECRGIVSDWHTADMATLEALTLAKGTILQEV